MDKAPDEITEIEANNVPSTNFLDNEFVSELNKLTIQERDEASYDVHGVSDVPNHNEDTVFVEHSIESFLSELAKIPDREKTAYLQAHQQNPGYVLELQFVLMFLRAAQFDASKAAERFVAFFAMKSELFGRDKLARDIRMDDLDQDDIACLESGYAQVLSARDRADRAIFVIMPTIRQFRTLENKLRAIYMVLMFALRDAETQKRGIVAIAYNIGRGRTKDRKAVFKNSQLVTALPLRFTAVHYCYDDEQLRTLFVIAMYVFEKAARIRVRFHLGTDMEVIYTLMTFGIPSESLPVMPNGTLRLDAHRDYVQKMRKCSQANWTMERIIVPGKYDVLLGRGKPLQKYSGNLNYHYVIECCHERYEAAAKGDKANLAMEIVKTIHAKGGRFLKQDDAGWSIISDKVAKSKVSHTFRNHRIAARTAYRKAVEMASKNLDLNHPGGTRVGNVTGIRPESYLNNSNNNNNDGCCGARDNLRLTMTPSPVEQKKMRIKDFLMAK